ncbi:hypothetical protein OAS39_02030 [Pirellulales bacterium]|nr:hypothetical protein [Pirellulales bacterium]
MKRTFLHARFSGHAGLPALAGGCTRATSPDANTPRARRSNRPNDPQINKTIVRPIKTTD